MTATPPLMEMIRRLVALPSVSSVNPALDMANTGVIDELAGWLSDAGYRVDVLPVPDHQGHANLIATLGEGPSGLVLAGHTDTVPYDEQRWTQDPFRLTQSDGKLYGLGTADMKAFFALAIEAAGRFAADDLGRSLVILATADEESSMSGAKALVQCGRPRADFAVIGEPTGLRPVRMHKGILMEGVRLIGQSGHSSNPALGNSALEGMHKVVDELLAYRTELQMAHKHAAFDVPVPTLNLGHIHGGDNPNRICGECELSLDLRPLPGMKIDSLRSTLHERVRDRLHDSGLIVEFETLFEGIPAAETDPNSEIVKAAEALTGCRAESVAFGTEAPYFQALGMEVVVLGPGDVAQAHQPDEYLALDRLEPTLDILTKLIDRFCVNST